MPSGVKFVDLFLKAWPESSLAELRLKKQKVKKLLYLDEFGRRTISYRGFFFPKMRLTTKRNTVLLDEYQEVNFELLVY